MDFEIEAWKLLRDGGTKNKPFKVIQDASKVIRDQIDSQLEKNYLEKKIDSDFFISSHIFREVWSNCITSNQEKQNMFIFEIGKDIVKMAMQKYLWKETKTINLEANLDFFLSFLNITKNPTSKFETVKLIDLVNLTDFVELSKIIGFNE